MKIIELIEKKRDHIELEPDEVLFIIREYTKGNIPDYQMAAFNMAVYLNGMSIQEKSSLTQAMLHSGRVMNLSNLKHYRIDKHSTGGVGDKLSLVIAPIVASLDIIVPMIGGRGLGHTGGTLDKLESIPQFKIDLTLSQFKENIEKIGCNIIGQTKEIAPADKKLYALRDVTGTVPSIPLITASIMSKKLAEDINGLVLDVKCGNGAFMKDLSKAIELAESLVLTGEHSGVNVTAFITDMSQPLGYKIGNWLEIEEIIDCLNNSGPNDVMQLSHLLAGTMIFMAGKAISIEAGIKRSIEQINNKAAFNKFIEIVDSQFADSSYIYNPNKYKNSSKKIDISADRSGFIHRFKTGDLGTLVVDMGGGRQKTSDKINPDVGIVLYHKIGDQIRQGDKIATLYIKQGADSLTFKKRFQDAITIKSENIAHIPLILKKITKNDILNPDSLNRLLQELI